MSASITKLNQVFIPIIRRVMPQIIAADIIGTGGYSRYGLLRKQLEQERHPVYPAIYNHFLRLNNRRCTQSDQDFRAAGYWHASGTLLEVVRWCVQTFGETGFWLNPRTTTIWFCTEQDYRLYQLTWT